MTGVHNFRKPPGSVWDHETSHEGKLSIAGLHVESPLRLPLKGSQGLADRSLCKFNQFSEYRIWKRFGWISKQNFMNFPNLCIKMHQTYDESSHDRRMSPLPSVNSCPQPNKLANEPAVPNADVMLDTSWG